ncbi:MAG TPA: isocitrate lyase/PEP mutase family protein [Candidatus Hydrogenedentes bacterium]|nr:isocitrate lyase/PEP mutase family protein [Candidatus Hydrogenedentota bacterium]
MNPRETLQHLLRTERPLVMPDAYDGLSARVIEAAGFKAVQCSGFSIALASRAIPETKLGFEKNLEITTDIVNSVEVPVMADGEDGFGPPERVFEAVRAFVDAGVSGINIEDQVLPPPETKRVVDRSLMIEKIRAAREAATAAGADDLVVNARTDALTACPQRTEGLREAVERGNAYLDAGADMIFVIGVDTLAEAARAAREIHGPVSIAAGMPNNAGAMSITELGQCGIARVSLPTVAILSSLRALTQTLSIIHREGSFRELVEQGLLAGMGDVARIMAR